VLRDSAFQDIPLGNPNFEVEVKALRKIEQPAFDACFGSSRDGSAFSSLARTAFSCFSLGKPILAPSPISVGVDDPNVNSAVLEEPSIG